MSGLGPFVPPSGGELDAATDEAATAWSAALADEALLRRLRISRSEVDGIAAIIATQFPDVPAVTLGRVLVSAAMSVEAVVKAHEMTGRRCTPTSLSVRLGMAGAQLATTGGEMTAMHGGQQ